MTQMNMHHHIATTNFTSKARTPAIPNTIYKLSMKDFQSKSHTDIKNMIPKSIIQQDKPD